MSPQLFQVLGWIAASCCLVGATAAVLLIIAHYWYKYHPDSDEPVNICNETLNAVISYQGANGYLCHCIELDKNVYLDCPNEEEAIDAGQKWLKELSKNS